MQQKNALGDCMYEENTVNYEHHLYWRGNHTIRIMMVIMAEMTHLHSITVMVDKNENFPPFQLLLYYLCSIGPFSNLGSDLPLI